MKPMKPSRPARPSNRPRAVRDWFQTSPHGTARERFERIAPLLTGKRRDQAQVQPAGRGLGEDRGEERDHDLGRFFRNLARAARSHDLGDESLYLAEELAGMQWSQGVREKRALALLTLATMVGVRQGSSCVPMPGQSSGSAPGDPAESPLGQVIQSLLEAGGMRLDIDQVMRDITALTRANTLDQIIGCVGDYRPLIVADGRVYQQRMLWCEDRLARRLRQLIVSGSEVPYLSAHETRIARALSDVLERAPRRGERAIVLSDEQQAVVRQALSTRFTVISGGPGTGKTSMVVTILRVLIRLGEPTSRIAMAAPTGKAANRMWSSIRSGLRAVADRSSEDDELVAAGLEPRTVHRLLGYLPGSDRFRHHENNPLAVSTLIVDEASMIDLWLMERLLRAVPFGTRVIVLGDADQLPSVDAGAVLRDLMLAGQDPGRAFGVRLTHSYRMDASDPAGRAILTAARAINAGRADELLAPESDSFGRISVRSAPKELAYSGVERLDSYVDISRVHEFVDHWYKKRIAAQPGFSLRDKVFRHRDGAWVGDDGRELARLFQVFERSRILTVTRRQNTGSEALNRRLHKRVLDDAAMDGNPSFYPGEPVIMRRNDYQRGLFNGDQGVIVRVSEDGASQQFRVVFARGDGFALFRLDTLRTHIELAFAMTVHKSQGSEFDEVVLVLPSEDVPLLTREMLYTGVTRARQSVVLVGSEELVRVAIERPSVRFSGLADKLLAGDRARDAARAGTGAR